MTKRNSRYYPGLSVNRLTLVSLEYVNSKDGHAYWSCKCECGKTKVICANHVVSGRTKSCGCLRRPLRIKKSINFTDLAWLAGLWEGEGYFGVQLNITPIAKLAMCDKDIVERVASILGYGEVKQQHSKNPKWKDLYVLRYCGIDAIFLMKSIKSYMGIRRKAKIEEIFSLCERNEYGIDIINGVGSDGAA